MNPKNWDPDGRIREMAAHTFDPLPPEAFAALPDFAELFSGPCRKALEVAGGIAGQTKADLVRQASEIGEVGATLRGLVACAELLDQCSLLIKAAHFRLTIAEAVRTVEMLGEKGH